MGEVPFFMAFYGFHTGSLGSGDPSGASGFGPGRELLDVQSVLWTSSLVTVVKTGY